MRSPERSLVRRVGWTAAACALVASASTLVVAIFVADQRALAEAETEALDRARVFISELESEGEFDEDRAHIADEIAEFSHGGIVLAVDRNGQQLAGSEALPRYDGEGCAFLDGGGETWLVCTETGQLGYRVRVGEPRAQLLSHREPLLMGGLAALLVVVLGSIFAGLVVARWSLAPLTRLRAALEALLGSNPAEATLALPRSGLVEVDVVAATLDDVLARLREEVLRSRHFAADAAHELRSPLTKLRTELELLLEEQVERSPSAERLARLVDRTQSLADLVDRLLMLASPRESLRSTTLVSLAVTVETVVEDAVGPQDRGRVEVSLEDDGMVSGDATVLAAMVSNALDNALKFSDGPVRASVSAEAGEVVFRVDDSGPGLDPAYRESVFEQFFRAPEHRAAPGHGIGLALIAHVVEAHGGRAAFVGEAPGAHLEIRLPRHAPGKVV